ncbi:hypothetical protein M407DRAFT_33762 [Tulasnella calospora MUT 4182]|uniref:Uncharacterized protein n=1 Tax=Tulasnella calospora MUT 4182 TaxID=1051891 RepID=A0A0C3PPZ5_9AGAM|nr:hypothetical protein M407DRAFT_33762 [Tulasnella calospora MUT 4182]
MTYHDVESADVLRPYCEAMGVANVDSLPKGKADPPDDVEIYCGMIGFCSIKNRVLSAWYESKPEPKSITSPIDTSMSYQFSAEELNDFHLYDANRAVRLVAEDEGKPFSQILSKPAGYDDWVSRDGTISVANWVSEKRHHGELDVNEIGRRMLKRSLFHSMGMGPPSSSSRLRNGIRRATTIKASAAGIGRPGTPYPMVNNIPLVAGPSGDLRLAHMGGGITSYPIPDSAGSHSFTATSTPHHDNVLVAENVRLYRELEELRNREVTHHQPGNPIVASSPITNEVGLNLMGLTVSEPPLVQPVPEKAFATEGDMNMNTN